MCLPVQLGCIHVNSLFTWLPSWRGHRRNEGTTCCHYPSSAHESPDMAHCSSLFENHGRGEENAWRPCSEERECHVHNI